MQKAETKPTPKALREKKLEDGSVEQIALLVEAMDKSVSLDEIAEKEEVEWRPGCRFENPESAYIRKETMQEQLAKLTDRQREVFVLYGAHIFHTNNKKVWNYITQFAEFNRFTNSPVANYKGELYSMPFNMYTFNKIWGVVTPEEAEAKINEQRAEITGEPQNLEEQAISMVGRDIFEKLIKGYTEKQWGRDSERVLNILRIVWPTDGRRLSRIVKAFWSHF